MRGVKWGINIVKEGDVVGGTGLSLVDIDVLAPKKKLVNPLKLLPSFIPLPLQISCRLAF
jgi:hypothetical protein